MALEDILDFDQLDPEQVEKEIAAGGLIPKGPYHAALAAVEEKMAGDNMKTEFVFQILTGQFKGRKVWHDIFHEGKTEEATKLKKNELLHFGVKLGCIAKEAGADGKPRYRPLRQFEHALGEEVVIDVTHERFNRKDPNSGLKAAVAMFGIHLLTDKEGQACLSKLGLVVSGATAPAPANGTTPGNGATSHGNGAPTSPPPQQPAKKRFNIDSL